MIHRGILSPGQLEQLLKKCISNDADLRANFASSMKKCIVMKKRCTGHHDVPGYVGCLEVCAASRLGLINSVFLFIDTKMPWTWSKVIPMYFGIQPWAKIWSSASRKKPRSPIHDITVLWHFFVCRGAVLQSERISKIKILYCRKIGCSSVAQAVVSSAN